jgi:tetratricopeptide (TPR) repeat protein
LLRIRGLEPPRMKVSLRDDKIQIIGVTSDDFKRFYESAYSLACSKEYLLARDAFFFLVAIAPKQADFWLGLSVASANLNEQAPALDAALTALTCDPMKAATYRIATQLYLRAKEGDKALALCQQGIQLGMQHSDKAFVADVQKVQKDIQEKVRNSHVRDF